MFPSQREFLRHILDECRFILRVTAGKSSRDEDFPNNRYALKYYIRKVSAQLKVHRLFVSNDLKRSRYRRAFRLELFSVLHYILRKVRRV